MSSCFAAFGRYHIACDENCLQKTRDLFYCNDFGMWLCPICEILTEDFNDFKKDHIHAEYSFKTKKQILEGIVVTPNNDEEDSEYIGIDE